MPVGLEVGLGEVNGMDERHAQSSVLVGKKGASPGWLKLGARRVLLTDLSFPSAKCCHATVPKLLCKCWNGFIYPWDLQRHCQWPDCIPPNGWLTYD
jgi:hypothetical protein